MTRQWETPDPDPMKIVAESTPGCTGRRTLAYTTADDGVHVLCSGCGFDANLGFWAGLAQVQEAEAAHACPTREDQP